MVRKNWDFAPILIFSKSSVRLIDKTGTIDHAGPVVLTSNLTPSGLPFSLFSELISLVIFFLRLGL